MRAHFQPVATYYINTALQEKKPKVFHIWLVLYQNKTISYSINSTCSLQPRQERDQTHIGMTRSKTLDARVPNVCLR